MRGFTGIPTCAAIVGATAESKVAAATTAPEEDQMKFRPPIGVCADEVAKGNKNRATHRIKVRRPEAHDEPDASKRIRPHRQRNFIPEISWSRIDEEAQGDAPESTTWLELYILYPMHGGWSTSTESAREIKLEKATSLSAGIKVQLDIKALGRQCVGEKDGQYFETSYARANRLRPLAITSKRTMLRGVSCIDEADARAITRAILAMKGIHQKKHRMA